MDSRHYKNTSSRWIKQGLIENAWQESKEMAKEWFKDPEKSFFEVTSDDGDTYNQSYIGEIKKRADKIKNKKIFNKEKGEQNFGGFIPSEDATTPNLLGADRKWR